MKKEIIIIIFFFVCLFFSRCNTPATNNTANNDSAASKNMYAGYASQKEWGQHLVIIGGCSDCHTPKKMTAQGPVNDNTLYLSGSDSRVPTPMMSADQIAKGIAGTIDLTTWQVHGALLMPQILHLIRQA